VKSADLSAIAAVLRGPPDPEMVENEARIRAAQLAGDADALEQLLDDDLLFTGPDGSLATKHADLEAHRSEAVRFQAHEPEELHVRRLGDHVAITALRARLVVAIGESIGRGTYRYTRIWHRDVQGSWRVVGGHVSEVREG
jgi:ketosteroid isomerase-like protein